MVLKTDMIINFNDFKLGFASTPKYRLLGETRFLLFCPHWNLAEVANRDATLHSQLYRRALTF